MAFNLKTFQTRALTAAVFVVVMLAGLCWNAWSFFILFSVIHFGCWFEYHRLMSKIDGDYGHINPVHQYAVMLTGWSLMLWFAPAQCYTGDFNLHQAGKWMGLVMLALVCLSEIILFKKARLKNLAYSAFGLVYISFSLGLLMNLYGIAFRKLTLTVPSADWHLTDGHFIFRYGWIVPAIIIGTLWINDTMAYITGSFIGKTPLSPISPKKTREGTIGGILLSVICTGLVCRQIFPALPAPGFSFHVPAIFWYMLAAVVAISGTIGDLLESKLKRMANVKDSGSFMPGHGGFLDRFDSMLLAVPFAWLCLLLL